MILSSCFGGVILNDELKAIKTINCIIMMIKLNLNARMGKAAGQLTWRESEREVCEEAAAFEGIVISLFSMH